MLVALLFAFFFFLSLVDAGLRSTRRTCCWCCRTASTVRVFFCRLLGAGFCWFFFVRRCLSLFAGRWRRSFQIFMIRLFFFFCILRGIINDICSEGDWWQGVIFYNSGIYSLSFEYNIDDGCALFAQQCQQPPFEIQSHDRYRSAYLGAFSRPCFLLCIEFSDNGLCALFCDYNSYLLNNARRA